MATNVYIDGFLGRYDKAIVVSNDSDLVLPIKMVGSELKLPVGLLSPVKYPHVELKGAAAFVRNLKLGHLVASQFPNTLTDTYGTITKPPSW